MLKVGGRMKILLSIALMLVIVFSLCMTLFHFSSNSAQATQEATLFKQLAQVNNNLLTCETSDDELILTIKSLSEDPQCLSVQDIAGSRAIRNEIRYSGIDTGIMKNTSAFTEIFLNETDEVIYDATIKNIVAIPVFAECNELYQTRNSKDGLNENVKQSVQDTLGKFEVNFEDFTTEQCGNLLKMSIYLDNDDFDYLNQLIADIQREVDSHNQSALSIHQMEITAYDTKCETILYLTSDFIYRDFLWWQTLAMNGLVWTKY